jgi:selenocysteine lyase/cysteine desulfurase
MPVMDSSACRRPRASFGIYNTREEVDALYEALLHAIRMLR